MRQNRENIKYNVLCQPHNTPCILFGSSLSCRQMAAVCPEADCMSSHSLRSTEHNFYSLEDFRNIVSPLKETYHEAIGTYKRRVNNFIEEAIEALHTYRSKQLDLVKEACSKIFTKVPEEQRAMEKVLKNEEHLLSCQEVSFIYQKYSNQKYIDHSCLDEIETLVESTMLDICDNNNIFKLDVKRRSSYVVDDEIFNIKKKAAINYEQVENENIRLLVSKWEKLEISQQQEIIQILKTIPWQHDEWDLSDGLYEQFEKILNVSRNIKVRQLKTLKLFKNRITTIKPLQQCKFDRIMCLFIAANEIESIEPLVCFQFPFLQKLSLYDNFIHSLGPLRKTWFPLEYLFLSKAVVMVDNNLIARIDGIKYWSFPRMSQLSLNSNMLTNEEEVLLCEFPKLYYLNLKNKEPLRNEEDKNVKEPIISMKYTFALL